MSVADSIKTGLLISKKPKPIKTKTPHQIHQAAKTVQEAEEKKSGGDKELQELSLRASKAEKIKKINDAAKSEIELKKARALLVEIETLGTSLTGYCIALNQSLLDQPRSFIDKFQAGLKTGKSKTELTEILREPATQAIKDCLDGLNKEIKRYRKAALKAEKVK